VKKFRSKKSCAYAMLIVVVAAVACTGGCSTSAPLDAGYVMYPAPPQRPRVQFLTQFAEARDIESESQLMKFLVGDVASARKLRKPTGIAAYGDVIYVADPGWDTVVVIDLENKRFDTLRDHEEGKLSVPVAIAIDADGQKFVADTGRMQVVEFDADSEFVWAYGNPSEIIPTGVAVGDRYLYVSDRRGNRVLVYDRRSKKVTREIGAAGKKDGQFNSPTSLSINGDHHLFVTDMANFRVQEFDAKGEHVKSYGFLGDGPGTFARPKGTSPDRSGHLYTVDAAFENVQIWDTSNAQALLAFGGSGVGPGQMYLPGAVFVSYDLNDYFNEFVDPDFSLEYVILVANNYGPNKVAVYGFVNPKDPSRYVDFSSQEESPVE